MDLSLNLIMMLPDALKRRLLKGNDFAVDNRTMHPGQQIILFFFKKEENH
ncbi:MAG: hypothetical protein Ct9H300mP6_10870 [Gammaproteobacteria bacterium]|nr:MAG: hypothetical protein Ct9H300mP6_10870 [Gammaproteobacteria bacterium]